MNFIAVDIGASSGRVIEFSYQNERLDMQEKHRFKNEMISVDNTYRWDINDLVKQVYKGLERCQKSVSIGIDTWGVDYVCLNDQQQIELPFSYRDSRTQNLNSCFSQKELFEKTGLGYLPFNTLYQLEVSKPLSGHFMMIPDYIMYHLTGCITNEFTNAMTTQLLNIKTKDFDRELLKGIKQDNLKTQKPTQLEMWPLTKKAQANIGYDSYVVQVATHDTASAFLGSYDLENNIVISLGTWSIVGCLVNEPIISGEAFEQTFSNEASINGQYRFQKNTMGTWMFENVKAELKDQQSYESIIKALYMSQYNQLIDVDLLCYLNPVSMKQMIDQQLTKNKQPLPQNNIEYYKLIFDSMVFKYIELITKIIELTNKNFDSINIVGGGCQNTYICQQLSQKLTKKVVAGPIEATAFGNVACQLLATKTIDNYQNFTKILYNSTTIKEYKEF